MITQNTIRFKCPIEDIPTKDDVLVSLDLGINFHIGTRENRTQKHLSKTSLSFITTLAQTDWKNFSNKKLMKPCEIS